MKNFNVNHTYEVLLTELSNIITYENKNNILLENDEIMYILYWTQYGMSYQYDNNFIHKPNGNLRITEDNILRKCEGDFDFRNGNFRDLESNDMPFRITEDGLTRLVEHLDSIARIVETIALPDLDARITEDGKYRLKEILDGIEIENLRLLEKNIPKILEFWTENNMEIYDGFNLSINPIKYLFWTENNNKYNKDLIINENPFTYLFWHNSANLYNRDFEFEINPFTYLFWGKVSNSYNIDLF